MNETGRQNKGGNLKGFSSYCFTCNRKNIVLCLVLKSLTFLDVKLKIFKTFFPRFLHKKVIVVDIADVKFGLTYNMEIRFLFASLEYLFIPFVFVLNDLCLFQSPETKESFY